jgi:KaiC/GvpD/RAD55 family RecA-like ATPase
MNIYLKNNKELKLSVPSFVCDDNPIGSHLNEYPMLSFLNSYGCNAFIGKPGSGKTSLVVSMLTGKGNKKVFRKCFNHILLVMPESSRKSMKTNIFEKHVSDKMFEELTLQTISTIYEKLLKSSADKENTLLILDDVGASLKNADIQQIMRRIIFNRRHLKVQILILLQNYVSCPLSVRKLFTNIFMFKPSKKEFEILFDENFEQKKDHALDIMKYVYKEPHDWLMLNVDTQRMFKKFDEIIIKSDNDSDSDSDSNSDV